MMFTIDLEELYLAILGRNCRIVQVPTGPGRRFRIIEDNGVDYCVFLKENYPRRYNKHPVRSI